MNKNLWIWAILIILVILGIWYFASSGSMSGTGENATTTATTTGTTGTTGSTNSGVTGGSTSFVSIFTQDGNYECVYDQVGTPTAHNIIRIADGKMYGEFRTNTSNGTNANFMIYSGGYLYSWKEGATTGKKSSISKLSDLPEAIPADLTSGAVLGASGSNNVGWNCHNWAKDAKQFTLPTYVTFSA